MEKIIKRIMIVIVPVLIYNSLAIVCEALCPSEQRLELQIAFMVLNALYTSVGSVGIYILIFGNTSAEILEKRILKPGSKKAENIKKVIALILFVLISIQVVYIFSEIGMSFGGFLENIMTLE